jgi:predicted Rossmann-fold nucleotide-binding protein
MKRICVFCGSRPKCVQAARQLSHTLAAKNIESVYDGGTSVGVMGKIVGR